MPRNPSIIPEKSGRVNFSRDVRKSRGPKKLFHEARPVKTARWETADMFRSDLAAARAVWIAEGAAAQDRAKPARSNFLTDVDAEGRRIDIHELRTTCGTWLDQAGVAPSVAERVTGHASDPQTDKTTRRGVAEGSADMTVASRLPTRQTTRGLRCQRVPTPAEAARLGLQTALYHHDWAPRVRSGTTIHHWSLEFEEGALFWFSKRPGAESGERHMGRIRQRLVR